MFASIREDVQAVLERDPAAYHWLQVVLCYPGLHALWLHRLAYKLWHSDFKLIASLIATFARWMTGIEIHPAAKIGPRLFIDHGMGVVIGETAEIGEDVTIYHGVTLGGVSLARGKRHPTIEDGVVIGTGAKVLGGITIGKNTRVGANAVVIKDIAPDMVVVGIPGKPMHRENQRQVHYPDMQHNNLPDVLSTQIDEIRKRLDHLEQHRHDNDMLDALFAATLVSEPDYTI